LRDDVAKIRHNLAHINLTKEYGKIDTTLLKLIRKYKRLIAERPFDHLENSDAKKSLTLKYKFDSMKRLHEKLHEGSSNVPSLSTLFKRYRNGDLDKLTHIDWEKSYEFCKEHDAEYRKLKQLQWRNIYMVEEE
jgi:hypothetical protein